MLQTYNKLLNIKPIWVSILGCVLTLFLHVNPNTLSLSLIIMWLFFAALYIYEHNDFIYKKSIFDNMFILYLIIIIVCGIGVIEYYCQRVKSNEGIVCVGYAYNSMQESRSHCMVYYMYYYDKNLKLNKVKVNGYSQHIDFNTNVVISLGGPRGNYIKTANPTWNDLEKYKYPVNFIMDSVELGNDSYEYAKYERDIAYNNFGLNIVQIANTLNDDEISFMKLNGISETIKCRNNGTDTFLVYSNINPKFFDGWHVCPDSISTPENFAKIEEGGYGYIFRGKIYSKEETEKYWNIIEQYKLREAGE